MENTKNKNSTPKDFSAVALGLELGFIISIPLVLFLLAGIFLDKKFGTLPLFLIAGILLSAIVTIVGVRNLLLPFLDKRSRK